MCSWFFYNPHFRNSVVKWIVKCEIDGNHLKQLFQQLDPVEWTVWAKTRGRSPLTWTIPARSCQTCILADTWWSIWLTSSNSQNYHFFMIVRSIIWSIWSMINKNISESCLNLSPKSQKKHVFFRLLRPCYCKQDIQLDLGARPSDGSVLCHLEVARLEDLLKHWNTRFNQSKYLNPVLCICLIDLLFFLCIYVYSSLNKLTIQICTKRKPWTASGYWRWASPWTLKKHILSCKVSVKVLDMPGMDGLTGDLRNNLCPSSGFGGMSKLPVLSRISLKPKTRLAWHKRKDMSHVMCVKFKTDGK